MKPLLCLAAVLVLAACTGDRPADSESRDSFHRAGSQSDKSYERENPAAPGQLEDKK